MILLNHIICIICPFRLEVRTSPFQGASTGSIPVRDILINKNYCKNMSNFKIYIIFFLISFIYCDFIFFDTSLNEYYHNYYSHHGESNNLGILSIFLLNEKMNIQNMHLLKEILNQHEEVYINSAFNMKEIWDLIKETEYNIHFYEAYASWIEEIKDIENDYIQKECLLNYSILLEDILENI